MALGKNLHIPPVFGFEAIHGVIIHGVELFLTKPVEKSHWQQPEHDMDKACVEPVHWKTIVRNLTNDPSTTTSAQIHL